MTKRIFMLAGPNGSGKTTTAMTLVPDFLMIQEFINADEIAKGLAPFHPESMALTASKLMIKRLGELLDTNKSFAFETTAAGTNYIKHLKTARQRDYRINLLFLWLSSPELAVKRVEQRVAQGGHYIPEETIRRRYRLGIKNLLKYYLPVADSALIVDNSVAGNRHIIAEKIDSKLLIQDEELWKKIGEQSH